MATPTLGYASRTEAVLALSAEGLAPAVIAGRIGISVNAVTGLVSSAARSKHRRAMEAARAAPTAMGQDVSPSSRLDVSFPQTTLRRLRPFASRRGISVGTLIQRIVFEVASEGMVDAVLDDGEAGAG
jgi:hypothetical protein